MKARIHGRAIHYELRGNGPCLLFSHSLGCDLRMWDAQVAHFSSTFTTLRYDIRGHGDSDLGDGAVGLDSLAGDVEALMDHLSIGAAHVVGISLGGLIAQQLALKSPHRTTSLVLADTTGRYPEAARNMWSQRASAVLSSGLEPIVEPSLQRWFTEAYLQQESAGLQLARDMLMRTSPSGYAACCLALHGADTLGQLSRVEAPALVLIGEHDLGTPLPLSQDLHDHLPSSELAIIPGAAHLSSFEQPRQFNALVERFLKQHHKPPKT